MADQHQPQRTSEAYRAHEWAIDDWEDDPFDATLSLSSGNLSVVATLDPDTLEQLIQALLMVREAQDEQDSDPNAGTDTREDFDRPEPLGPDRTNRARARRDSDPHENQTQSPAPLAGAKRVSGWHQINLYWQDWSPVQRAAAVAVVAVLFLAIVIVARLVQ